MELRGQMILGDVYSKGLISHEDRDIWRKEEDEVLLSPHPSDWCRACVGTGTISVSARPRL